MPKRYCCAFFFACLLAVRPGYAARVYFADQPQGAAGSIISVAPDGTGQQTVTNVTGASDLRGVAYHRASGRIYFLDNGTAKRIYSILPNGTGSQEVTSLGGTFNADLEIDEATNKIYWAENIPGVIKRANLNGTGVETPVNPGGGEFTAPYFLFVDATAGYIYWGVTGDGDQPSNFRRAAITNGVIDPNFSITSPTRSRDIAIDPATAMAYWCDRQTGAIYRRALSGGANQTVIANMNAPHGIALDLEAEKIYWADTGARGGGPFNTSARRIARCNFDGTEYENISTPAVNSEPWDLALDVTSPSYAEWRTRFFSASAQGAGPNDDPDADGAVNLLEYSMGAHPKKSSSVPRIVPQGTGMRYTRRRPSNLTYRIDVSTNLVNWNFNFDGTGQVWTLQTSVTPVGPDLESVGINRGSALAQAPRVFFRVRVTAP